MTRALRGPFLSLVACLVPLACQSARGRVEAAPSASAAAPTPQPAPLEGKVFGAAIDRAIPFVSLESALKEPQSYAGKRVRTRGEVVAVCQNMGCWADLRPQGSASAPIPVHVSMRGHAFFLPKDAKSKLAEVDGTLGLRELSVAEVEHYNSEGASLVAGTKVLTIDAEGVVLR